MCFVMVIKLLLGCYMLCGYLWEFLKFYILGECSHDSTIGTPHHQAGAAMMCGDGKQAYREVPVPVKTAEELYKEWWLRRHPEVTDCDQTESELHSQGTD
jgi:hypothetical protein